MSNAAPGTGIFCASADDAPSQPGAYVLAVALARPVTVALAGKPTTRLPPGRYLYCGSARGPGGLRARLRRHMRRGKAVRWHVDRLTEAGAALGAWVFPGGDECDLAAALSSLPSPIAGFGSTDCACCRAHLFRWPEAMDIVAEAQRLQSVIEKAPQLAAAAGMLHPGSSPKR